MSWCRVFVLCLAVSGVAACGFRPLYLPPAEDTRGGSEDYAIEALRSVAIGNIRDREGQYLRNRLLRLLHPGGRDPSVKYNLSVSFSVRESSLAVQKSAIATRAVLDVVASYALVPVVGQDLPETKGSVTSESGYNIFNSEFQTLLAKKGARERALDDVAEQIRVRLAVFLTRGEPADADR